MPDDQPRRLTETLLIQIHPEQKERVRRAAFRNYKTMSGYVRDVLADAVRREEATSIETAH